MPDNLVLATALACFLDLPNKMRDFSCMILQDFAEVTFQHLAPVCASARGDALLLLTRHADIFAGRLPRDPCTRVLLPLLARAADQGIASPSLPLKHPGRIVM